ncbi:hypothetical protein H6P81_007208 [Aristolochia fimbriata]|uniref:AP complex mu/sigma subunit domain-containing protein n=1 Tax=Aristolochia fimbriata TaxID=158543 RepID=A0AAV7F091_ARIFI|nr:hypothetical protein H6P81_007208 [Aristolochia fimbriata]
MEMGATGLRGGGTGERGGDGYFRGSDRCPPPFPNISLCLAATSSPTALILKSNFSKDNKHWKKEVGLYLAKPREIVQSCNMIQAVIVMNTQGKPRLVKFYNFLPVEKQQELIRNLYGVLCSRAENVSNFVQADAIFGPGTRLVYKHYATLYFVFVFDSCENDLAMLDLIQVFVETLDKCFKNVCELDIVFNFNKMHTILDEIVVGGQVLETSSTEVMKAIDDITKMEKSSNAISLVPKTVSSR